MDMLIWALATSLIAIGAIAAVASVVVTMALVAAWMLS
jgi:hypothetical protein